MQHLLQFGLSNAVAAAVLAVLAAVATRVWRNPHFAYALWFVVLLRLVAPPLLPVGVPVPQWMAGSSRQPLPTVRESQRESRPPADGVESIALAEFNRAKDTGGPKSARGGPVAPEPGRPALSSRAPAVRASALVAQTPVLEDRGDPEGAPPRGSSAMSQGVSQDTPQSSAFRWPSIANFVAVTWLSGTLCYLLLTALRVRRFSRVLRRARRVVPAGVAAEAADVANVVGLRRVPRLAFAEAALPPMVWPGWRPVVLLPEVLFTSLGAGERRLLLCHEFLHLRRRDHLVRWFEVGVVALYWWNPVAWWAVARLQAAEEDCCDAAVLVAHPHDSARYGETLVSVAQFLSTGTLPAPSLSVGVARNGHIKRRLTMILHGPRWPELSKTRLAAFSLLGAALVAVTWTAAKAQTAPATPATSPGPAASVSSASPPQPAGKDDDKSVSKTPFEKIDEILAEGNTTIPTAAILRKMRIQAGRTATPGELQEDIRTLIKTRWFASIVPKYRHTDKKLVLVLAVIERPIIRSVVYQGATQIALKRLAAETGLKVGSPYDMGANKEEARHLESFYHEQGYTKATVVLIKGDKPEDRDVVFSIHEGIRQKVIWRYFVGNASVPGERLAMQLKSTPAYVSIGGRFDPSNLAEDVAAVRKYYASLGFFDATVTPTVEYSKDDKWIYLKYTIHEGPRRPPARPLNVDTKAAAAKPTVPLPEKRDVGLSQIKEMQPAPGDDELRKLQKERYNAALRELKLNENQFDMGTTRVSAVSQATRKFVEAWQALAQQPAEELRAVDWYVDSTNRLWKGAHARLMAGGTTGFAPVDEAEARAARFEAQIEAMKLHQRYEPAASKTDPHIEYKLEQPQDAPPPPPNEGQQQPPAAPKPGVVPNRPKNDQFFPLYLKHPDQMPVAPTDDPEHRQLKEKYNAAVRAMDEYLLQLRGRRLDLAAQIENIQAAALKLRDAELALCPDAESKLGTLGIYLDFLRNLQKFARTWVNADGSVGASTPLGEARLREACVQMQLNMAQLLREQAEKEREKQPPAASGVVSPSDLGPTAAAPSSWNQPLAQPPGLEQRPIDTSSRPRQLPQLLTARPLEVTPQDDASQKSLKQHYNAALRSLQGLHITPETNLSVFVNALMTSARQLIAAEVMLARPDELPRAYERFIELMKYFDSIEIPNPDGSIDVNHILAISDARRKAELKLLELKRNPVHEGQSKTPTTDAASTRGRPIETAIEARHESAFTAVKRPSTGSTFLLDLMYPKRIEAGASDDETQRLLKEKYNAAARTMQVYQKQLEAGNLNLVTQINNLLAAAQHLRDAELALDQRQEIQLGVLETYLDFTRYLEQAADGWVKTGGVAGVDAPLEAARMREARADAEFSVHNLQRDMTQRELRNPTAFLKVGPTNTVPTGNALPALLTRTPLDRRAHDDEWHKLLKERFNAAVRGLQASYNRHKVDPSTAATNVIAAARRVLEADLALTSDSEYSKQAQQSVVDAWQRYFELTKFLEQKAEARFNAKFGGLDELEAAREARLEAELKLLEAQRAKAAPAKAEVHGTTWITR
jgi:beta-lactamase regulating signal transducer with metallopeptidase domain